MHFLHYFLLYSYKYLDNLVKDTVFISGIGLHSSKPVNLKILPSNVNTGIIFKVELLTRSISLKCGASASPVINIISQSMSDATIGEQNPVALSCAQIERGKLSYE